MNDPEFVNKFVREAYVPGYIDRDAAFDAERRYARGVQRRQIVGVGMVLALKSALGYFVYEALGWPGVVVFGLAVALVLFMRGTHAYPGTER